MVRLFQPYPPGFFRKRLKYALDKIDEEIALERDGHPRSVDGQIEKRIEAAVDALRRSIEKAISDIEDGQIVNQNQLQSFCARVTEAVARFASTEGAEAHSSARGREIAQAALGIERKVLRAIFQLTPGDIPKDAQGEFDKLQTIFQQAKEVISLKDELRSALGLLAQDGKHKEEDISLIHGYARIGKLLELFPNEINFEQVPPEVEKTSRISLAKYREALDRIAHLSAVLLTLEQKLQPHIARVERLGKAVSYFDIVVHFNEWSELIPDLERLKDLGPALEEVLPMIKSASTKIREWNEATKSIRESADIGAVARKIVMRMPKEDRDSEVIAVFASMPQRTVQLQQKPAGQPMQSLATLRKEGERFAAFHWKEATPEQRRAEAHRRLFGNPKLTLVKYLFEAKRWNDLRKFLEKISSKDLQESGLSSSAIGPKAPYKGNEDFLKVCFPEAYGPEGERPVSTLARGASEVRFHWKRAGISSELIQAEVRKRLFEGWPLIKDLIDQQKGDELRQLLERIDLQDLRNFCRLSPSCIGGEGAPFTTKEEMFMAVFPDIYRDLKSQGS